jgi:putative glutamine amidotransferase
VPPTTLKPLVAIAPCRKMPDYEESVRRAGGEPWVLDYEHDRASVVVASCGGLLLPGGADVGPERYGEEPHPSVTDVDRARDEHEIALVMAALDADLPILAICRGLQVLNVAAGGSLVQDIPSQVPGALTHKVPDPQDAMAHSVRVTPGSRLASLMRGALSAEYDLDVNSRHHQSARRVAEGFEITAIALDGVIEALEHPGARFCMAVQWHPENFLRTGAFLPLFAGLIQSAR